MGGCRVPRERFFQFSWRPRALSLLSEEQERDIQRNLKTNYSRRYEEEDLAALHEVRRLMFMIPCSAA